MSRYIDRIISGALVVAALAMATAVVSRTFADPVRTRQNSGPTCSSRIRTRSV